MRSFKYVTVDDGRQMIKKETSEMKSSLIKSSEEEKYSRQASNLHQNVMEPKISNKQADLTFAPNLDASVDNKVTDQIVRRSVPAMEDNVKSYHYGGFHKPSNNKISMSGLDQQTREIMRNHIIVAEVGGGSKARFSLADLYQEQKNNKGNTLNGMSNQLDTSKIQLQLAPIQDVGTYNTKKADSELDKIYIKFNNNNHDDILGLDDIDLEKSSLDESSSEMQSSRDGMKKSSSKQQVDQSIEHDPKLVAEQVQSMFKDEEKKHEEVDEANQINEDINKNDANTDSLTKSSKQFKSFERKSFFLFSQNSKLRTYTSTILSSIYFDYFLLLVLLANCLLLGFYESHLASLGSSSHSGQIVIDRSYPLQSQHHSEEDSTSLLLDRINLAFSCVYLVEALLKIIRNGLWGRRQSYMRDGWNWIDIGVIIEGMAEIGYLGDMKLGLRVARNVMRPLKCINALPSVKTLLQSLIFALPEFGNVAIFMIFVFVLFATMGLQQYNGSIYNTCRLSSTPIEIEPGLFRWEEDPGNAGRACSKTGIGNFVCPDQLYCGNEGVDYPLLNFEDPKIENRLYLNFGVTNFDNLGSSLLTVFQMITSETWYTQIVNLSDLDMPILAAIYSLSVIIVGQFFLLNLILAVMIEAFKKSHEEHLQEAAFKLLESQNSYDQSYDQEDEGEEFEEQEENYTEPICTDSEYGQEQQQEPQPYEQQTSNDVPQITVDQNQISQELKDTLQELQQPAAQALSELGEDPVRLEDLVGGIGGSIERAGPPTNQLNINVQDLDDEAGTIEKRESNQNFSQMVKRSQSSRFLPRGPKQSSIIDKSILNFNSKINRKGSNKQINQVVGLAGPHSKKSSANLLGPSPAQLTADKSNDGQPVKRTVTSKMTASRNQNQPGALPLFNMANLITPANKLVEEQKKYEEKQDFKVFMKELVMKRRVVNLLMNEAAKRKAQDKLLLQGPIPIKPAQIPLQPTPPIQHEQPTIQVIAPTSPEPLEKQEPEAPKLPVLQPIAASPAKRGRFTLSHMNQRSHQNQGSSTISHIHSHHHHHHHSNQPQTQQQLQRLITPPHQVQASQDSAAATLQLISNIIKRPLVQQQNNRPPSIHTIEEAEEGEEDMQKTRKGGRGNPRASWSGVSSRSSKKHKSVSPQTPQMLQRKRRLIPGKDLKHQNASQFMLNAIFEQDEKSDKDPASNQSLANSFIGKKHRPKNHTLLPISPQQFMHSQLGGAQSFKKVNRDSYKFGDIVSQAMLNQRQDINRSQQNGRKIVTMLPSINNMVVKQGFQENNLNSLLPGMFLQNEAAGLPSHSPMGPNFLDKIDSNMIVSSFQHSFMGGGPPKAKRKVKPQLELREDPSMFQLGQNTQLKNNSSIIAITFIDQPEKIASIHDIKNSYESSKVEAKLQGSANPQTNNLFQTLVVKFGPVIRQKILQMQAEAKKKESKYWQRRMSSKIIDFCCTVAENQIFSAFMIMVIFANEIIIACDTYPIDIERLHNLESMNIGITIFFILEIIIRMTALGIQEYLKAQKVNLFDCVIVSTSIIDIIVSQTLLRTDEMVINSIGITLLRATRAITFLKLARYWDSFTVLLENLYETLLNIKTFTILLVIVIYIYVLLGLSFFANKAHLNHQTLEIDPVNGHSPMYNFDNMMQSVFTTFVIFTNDGQSLIYYNFYRAVSGTLATIWWLTFIIITQKILLNLFLAILLQKFEEAHIRQQMIRESNEDGINEEKTWSQRVQEWAQNKFNYFLVQIRNPGNTEKVELNKLESNVLNSITKKVSFIKEVEQDPIQGASLGFIPNTFNLRRTLHHIISHPRFDQLILLNILASALMLALDAPTVLEESQLKDVILWVDRVTIAIFTLEFLAKVFTYGFLMNGQRSYLRNLWNILDFIILIFSYICLSSLAETFKVIKTFRILRSLRLIGKNEGLKVAVRALLFAIPNIMNITIMMVLFHSIFGIIAMSYFKGKMHYCTNQPHDAPAIHTKWECQNEGGLWENRLYNFDTMSNSLISLFVMSTTAGWADVVVQTISGTGFDEQGDESNRPAGWTVFFMCLMIVAHFFFLNLFIVVVIQTFHTEQDRESGSDLLTTKQKEWIDLRLLILRSEPIKKITPPDQRNWRLWFLNLQNHRYFEKFIQIAIIMNTITLMIKWHRQPESVTFATEIFNQIYTAIFIVEAAVRILGIGFKNYFKDPWNVFDFIVVLSSIISILISFTSNLQIKAITILRSFRMLRLLRLLKRGGKSLYLIFNTFVNTMQSLANIGRLLLLLMYIYSIIGMIYFGEQKRNYTMNDYINFESFTSAFITLFTVATVDSWNYTMISFAYIYSPANQCVENPTYLDYKYNDYKMMGCGSPTRIFIFFISFMFLVSLVFLKLFIAIILEGYKETQTQDTRLFNSDMNQHFREVWSEFDPDATSYINMSKVRDFLFKLGAPLGFDDSFLDSRYLQDKFIASLELPIYNDFSCYSYHDMLDALSFRLMILDHINKLHEDHLEKSLALQRSNARSPNLQHEQLLLLNLPDIDERQIKDTIEHEVNRLLFQKKSENIVAFRELWEKEQRKKRQREEQRDKSGFTSQQQMAVEVLVRRIKVILQGRREERKAREEAEKKEKKDEESRPKLPDIESPKRNQEGSPINAPQTPTVTRNNGGGTGNFLRRVTNHLLASRQYISGSIINIPGDEHHLN